MKTKQILPTLGLTLAIAFTAGCENKSNENKTALPENKAENSREVVIYSNADDEAIAAMTHALDNNGFQGKYNFMTFGTSVLGGKLLIEGSNIEADMITMSTFYVNSAQEKNKMFKKLSFNVNTLEKVPEYTAPITSQEGAIIVNTDVLKKNKLQMPTSLKDLAKPMYKGFLSVTDVKASSTAWLLMQALVSAYGDFEAETILRGIYKNSQGHLESSGSKPLKLCEAGEVAIGFGLRHQAVRAKAKGLPIEFVDPIEGNFSLTESVAVIDKGANSNPLAMQMAKCIIENGRKELLENYPNVLYTGETSNSANKSKYPRTFERPLTFELYMAHQKISENAK